jgi:hypothetical protein
VQQNGGSVQHVLKWRNSMLGYVNFVTFDAYIIFRTFLCDNILCITYITMTQSSGVWSRRFLHAKCKNCTSIGWL